MAKADEAVDRLCHKIRSIIDYNSILSMEDELNKVGLTVQTTSNSRILICKLINGKPLANTIVDDYIFIGSVSDGSREISEAAASKICDFVRNAAGKAGKIQNVARVWRNGLRMYDSTIAIMNEDINAISQVID